MDMTSYPSCFIYNPTLDLTNLGRGFEHLATMLCRTHGITGTMIELIVACKPAIMSYHGKCS